MTDLTGIQRVTIRHALGLDTKKRSFRNRFIAFDEPLTSFEDLVGRGLAVRIDQRNGPKQMNPGKLVITYVITRAGAEAVLQPGESLDDEDFEGIAA